MTAEMIEFHSVVLGALLHDVGKLLQRESSLAFGKSHQAHGADFIEENRARLERPGLYDLDLVKFFVCHHHKKGGQDAITATWPVLQQRDRVWKLLGLVERADDYSCKERVLDEQEKRAGTIRHAPLESIFSRIRLEAGADDATASHYMADALDPLNCFPRNLDKLTDENLARLIRRFRDHLPDFSKAAGFSEVLNLWQNHLAAYLWAVPSDTRYDHSDVSLFDHLRSSAAIAACLHRVHRHRLETKQGLSRSDEFIFIAGDFSGIQDFIFNITNLGSSGAAKRLRARSMFVSMFCEATIHKVLHALDLPLICNLFSAGGKFLLVAPGLPEVGQALEKVKREVQKEIHSTFFGQFAFLMHWRPIERFETDWKVFRFYDSANQMFDQLAAEKTRKLESVLVGPDGRWDPAAFRADDLYRSYGGNPDCRVCGRGAAAMPEGPDDDSPFQCRLCYRDHEVIGTQVPKCRAVAFGRGDPGTRKDAQRITLFHSSPSYFVDLVTDDCFKPEPSHYLVQALHAQGFDAADGKFLNRYSANHVPSTDGRILTFEEIAGHGLCGRGQDNPDEELGRGMLGVLKADVDNLGLIFNKGFENPAGQETGYAPEDRKTISRLLTLSRMTDLFFTGWVRECMQSENQKHITPRLDALPPERKDLWRKYLGSDAIDFSMIYTVYSGGDDMVLIGPWQTMIVYAALLNLEFRRYTGNNPDITLSAGLAIIKPKFPVAEAIRMAEFLLEQSKASGKDRISVFGKTVRWSTLPELVDFFLFLNDALNDSRSRINTAFVHRLFEYHRMAEAYTNDLRIEGLKYISALWYDFERNIVEREKGTNRLLNSTDLLGLQPLLSAEKGPNALIHNLCIPLSWALYRIREQKKAPITKDTP